MKINFRLSTLLFFSLLSFLSNGQNIEVSSVSYDFGKILESDGVVSTSFKVKSLSADTLKVKNIDASCRCVSGVATDSTIAPLSELVLNVSYDPVESFGVFEREVKLFLESKDSVVFSVSGEVIPQSYFNKAHFRYNVGGLKMKTKAVQMGQISAQSSNNKTVYVLNPDTISHEIKYKETDSVAILVEGGQVRSFNIRLDATPELGLGYRVDTMKFLLDEQMWSLPVAYTITPRTEIGNGGVLHMDTTYFDFGREKKGDVVSHSFGMMNKGEAPLHITNIESECDCVKYTLSEKTMEPDKSAVLKLDFDTAHGNGTQRKKVRIFTDSAKTPVIIVTLKATVSS